MLLRTLVVIWKNADVARIDGILIGLSPTAIRVAGCHGRRIVRTERVGLEPAMWAEAWSKGLRPLDTALSGVLAAMQVAPGTRVTLVYAGLETHVDLASIPGTGAAALEAADLSLRESVKDVDSRVSAMNVQLVERGGKSAAPARTHVLVQTESAEHAEVLATWVRRAGLRCGSLIPSRSGVVAATVREVVEKRSAEAPEVFVWVDDHTTVLTASHAGRLQFVRIVDVGYWKLADSIVRGAEGRPVDRRRAYQLLFAVGIPQRGQMVDASLALRAESVLPTMQSVLQRLGVEIKQTLRFGLPETEVTRATVHFIGPGARVPGLARHFAGELDCSVNTPDGDGEAFDEEPGELATTVSASRLLPEIVPPTERGRRERRRLSVALAVGVVLAVGIVGADYWRVRESSLDVERRRAELAPRVEAVRARRDRQVLAASIASEVRGGMRLLGQSLGSRPNWKSVLLDLAALTPESIELAELAGEYPRDGAGSAVVSLRGMASSSTDGSPDDMVAKYVDRLSRSPLVESARVVSTHAERSAGKDVVAFVVAAQVRSLPVSVAAVGEHGAAE